jgi:hypothetical protein
MGEGEGEGEDKLYFFKDTRESGKKSGKINISRY